MCPCCSPPSRLPAPRSSRSRAAILNPAPRSLNSFKAARRLRAISVSSVSGSHQQITIRAPVRPSHASAQLIQLRQAVLFRVLDDHGVGERDIEPVLHDRGRDEYVELMPHELQHHLFEFGLRHLPMAHADAHRAGTSPAPSPRDARWNRCGCARNKPGRRARVPAQSPA